MYVKEIGLEGDASKSGKFPTVHLIFPPNIN